MYQQTRRQDSFHFRFPILLATVVSLGLMLACNKKDDNGRPDYATSGNVETDGSIVNSNTMVNGVPINMSVSNIQKNGNTTTTVNAQQNYNVLNNYNSYQLQPLQLTLNINGVASNLQIQPSLVGMQTNTQTPYTILSAYSVYYDAKCIDVACSNAYIVLWVSMQNAQQQGWKQMGIYKNMQENKIGSSVVNQGPASQLPTMDVVIQQLQSLYENR